MQLTFLSFVKKTNGRFLHVIVMVESRLCKPAEPNTVLVSMEGHDRTTIISMSYGKALTTAGEGNLVPRVFRLFGQRGNAGKRCPADQKA